MQTQTFDFYIDRKVTIWIREQHSIEAESEEEAEKEMIARFKTDEIYDTFVEQEYLIDTIEEMETGDNSGNPTCELYNDDMQIITTNIDLVDSK